MTAMLSLHLSRVLILALSFVALSAAAGPVTVTRNKQSFPTCVEGIEGKNLFLRYARRSLTRTIRYKLSRGSCHGPRPLLGWKLLGEDLKRSLPEELRFELDQIAKRANEFRRERTAAEFVDRRGITAFTKDLNRELTPRYGAIFSAEVFRELEERKPGNREFRQKVLEDMRKNKASEFNDDFRQKVKLVVSFGLGWSHDYGDAAPSYIKDFLADIDSLGFEVNYLEKNPFGKITANVDRITPQLEDIFAGEKKVILISLCKGTPELYAGLSRIPQEKLEGKILGHVNLSGMLTGTFFADIGRSVFFPKILAPILKVFPFKSMKDAGRMVSSADFMKSTIVEDTLSEAGPRLPRDILTVNVTGAPFSDRVVKGSSPMAPIIRYNSSQKFLVSANDGFIELPHTLVPETISARQVTLILDASHMLTDGYLEEFELSDPRVRELLYGSILRFILEEGAAVTPR